MPLLPAVLRKRDFGIGVFYPKEDSSHSLRFIYQAALPVPV